MSIEKAAGILSGVLKMDAKDVTEKLGTDDGVKELSDKLSKARVFLTPDEEAKYLNNYLESKKDLLYKEQKINIHAAIEREIAEEHGLNPDEFKGKFTKDYIKAAIDKKTSEMQEELKKLKANNSGGKNDEEIAALTKTLNDQKATYEGKITSITDEANKKVLNYYLDSELANIAETIAVEESKLPAQKNLIKMIFLSDYTTREKDGKIEVLKGEVVVRNANHEPMSVRDVLSQIRDANVPVKTKVPNGRKDLPGVNGGGSIDWSTTSWEDYLQTDSGKSLVTGSPEWQKVYGDYKKATGK